MALTARLGAWEKPVHHNQIRPSPARLIRELSSEFPKTNILNGTGKVVVFNRAFNIQIFNRNSGIIAC